MLLYMHRSFQRPNAEHPETYDYFSIKTRWLPGKQTTRVTMLNFGKYQFPPEETITDMTGEMNYHQLITDITEELLDEGWREV